MDKTVTPVIAGPGNQVMYVSAYNQSGLISFKYIADFGGNL